MNGADEIMKYNEEIAKKIRKVAILDSQLIALNESTNCYKEGQGVLALKCRVIADKIGELTEEIK